jgi:hypothetical protein
MATKFKIKGRVYTLIEELDIGDPDIIKRRAILVDSKGVKFTYISSVIGHYLYDDKEQRVVDTLSVQEWVA